ncbi:MAG: RagB/SusD family nutrient uptake outer membrane protein, partial [Bacteroidota bacterium]
VAPTGSLSSNELTSLAGVDGTLIGAYSILLGRGGFYSDATNWFWGSVLGGDANKGTNEGDQSQMNEIQAYQAQTNNGSVLEKYSRSYEGVARCNATLQFLSESTTIGTGDAARLEGEARFLRGHYYFELKKNYDNTPYVDQTWDEVTLVGNGQDLWPFIEADLKFAYDNLPETQSDAGRANKWAAGAYYAKALLFQGKFSDANTVLQDVMANGVTARGEAYGLNENYADAFFSPNDNSKESVFASQAAAGTGTVNNANPGMVLNFPHGGGDRPGGCCGFFQPSIELANSFRTGADGLPLLDGSYNSDANKLVTDQGLASADAFTPDAGNLDPRIDHSIGRRGIPYLDWGLHPGRDWIRDQPYGGPYSPKKFIYYRDVAGNNDGSSWTPGYTTVNYNIIRYADVILWAAECQIELNNLDAGRDLINMVRDRARNSMIMNGGAPAANYVIEPYASFASQDEARSALRMERKLELSGEGHRLYDLVRWGVAAEQLNTYLSVENAVLINSSFSGASFQAGKNEFLPIPQNEIDLLGADILRQNPGY